MTAAMVTGTQNSLCVSLCGINPLVLHAFVSKCIDVGLMKRYIHAGQSISYAISKPEDADCSPVQQIRSNHASLKHGGNFPDMQTHLFLIVQILCFNELWEDWVNRTVGQSLIVYKSRRHLSGSV